MKSAIHKISEMIEVAEIKLSRMCFKAKQDWQRLQKEGHENAYAASLRYETLREAANIMADLGAAVDEMETNDE